MALFDHTNLFNRFELLIWKIKNPEKLEINNIANSIAKKNRFNQINTKEKSNSSGASNFKIQRLLF